MDRHAALAWRARDPALLARGGPFAMGPAGLEMVVLGGRADGRGRTGPADGEVVVVT